MKLLVTYVEDGVEDAEITVSASARHLWESEHGALLDSMRSGTSGWADFLAFTTLQRRGDVGADVELIDWLDGVESVKWRASEDNLVRLAEALGVKVDRDGTGGGDAAVPTGRPARTRSRGSSSTPPSTPDSPSTD